MNPDITGLRNVTVTDAVAVSTTSVVLGGVKRSAIKVANPGGVDVYLKFSAASATNSTIATDDYHEVIAAGDTSPWFGVSESVKVWAYAASATTVNVIEGAY